MAQLELATVPATNGAAVKAIAAGTGVEADGQATASSFSFSQLLQSDAPKNPATAVLSALAAGPAAIDLAARAGDAGEPLAAATPPAGLEQVTGADGSGEPEEPTAGIEASDGSETASAEVPAETVWPGLPLFMDARAALRNEQQAAGAELAPSDETATATAVDTARLRAMLRQAPAADRLSGGGRSAIKLVGEAAAKVAKDGAEAAALVAPLAEKASGLPPVLTSAIPSGASAPKIALEALGLPPAPEPTARAVPAGAGREPAVAVSPTAPAVAAPAAGPSPVLAEALQAPPVRPSDARPPVEAVVAAGSEAEATSDVEPVVNARPPAPLGLASTVTASVDDGGIANYWRPLAPPTSLPAPLVRPSAAHPLRWQPNLAESLVRAGVEPSVAPGVAAVAPSPSSGIATTIQPPSPKLETDREAIPLVTMPSLKGLNEAGRGLTPVGQPSSGLAAFSEQALAEVAANRPDAPTPPNSATPTQASPLALGPTRLDAPTSSGSLLAAPEVLNLHQKDWERTLGQQLSWMVNNQVHEAEIKVNPPDLGPLEVRVSLHHNQTNVSFFSHEAAVREVLETALPRLRELLDAQGISLNHTQVADQSLARQQAGAGEQSAYGRRDDHRTPTTAPGAETTAEPTKSQPRTRGLKGAVDDYV